MTTTTRLQARRVPLAPFRGSSVVLGLTAAAVVVGLGFEVVTGTDRIANPFLPAIVVSALLNAVLGYLVARRHAGHPVGRLLQVAGALGGVVVLTGGYANVALFGPWTSVGAEWSLWLTRWIWVPASALAPLGLMLLFPDGRLPSPRWRLAALVATGGVVALTLQFATAPFTETVWRGVPVVNPVGPLPSGLEAALVAIASPWWVLGMAVGSAAVVVRYRRAAATDRARLAIVLLPAVLLPPALLAGQLFGAYGGIAEMLVTAALEITVAVAMLRHRMFDIDVVLNRAVVYALLAVSLVGAYVSIVVLVTAVVGSRWSQLASAIAAGVVAVALWPLLIRLRRGVDRLLYGERGTPDAVLGRLAAVHSGADRPAMLDSAAEALRVALAVPWVRVTVGDTAGEAGVPRTTGREVPIRHGGRLVGQLAVGKRYDDERASSADDRVLAAAAGQLAVTAEALLLAERLREARERLVGAREDERRRVRRDLHDGLGPALAGITAALEGLEEIARTDAVAAVAGLPALRAQARTAVTDVRRLVDGLRPPALDELGLVDALREELRALGASGTVRYTLDSPTRLPDLPAAVEVAALRIALEAATNSLRHARASWCTVSLTVDEEGLQVQVQDDGVGLPADLSPGVGLTSMRERAEEIGGGFSVESGPGGGTTVTATLPLTLR